jgi:hypothetical protein
MQQPVCMHLAQAVEHLGEHVANEVLGDPGPVLLDQFLQGAPMLVLHHHVDRLVGTKKIQHPDHVGVRKAGQRPTFFEKAFHAVAESRQMIFADDRRRLSLTAQGQRIGQVLLDGDALSLRVDSDIDDRKAAQRKLVLDAILVELETGRKGVVRLLRHPCQGYH